MCGLISSNSCNCKPKHRNSMKKEKKLDDIKSRSPSLPMTLYNTNPNL